MLKHYPSMHPKGARLSGVGRFLVMDSEAIGFVRQQRKGDSTSMHCIVVKDDQTNEIFSFFDPYEKRDPENREYLDAEGTQAGYLIDGIKFLMDCECIIAQNISGYDALSFEKVFQKEWSFNYMESRGKDRECYTSYPNKIMDTYNMSCVLNPERRVPPQAYALGKGNVGAHSIEAHGIRMGRYKPDNEDWTKLTDHMLHRCAEDTEIGQDMFRTLMGEWNEQAFRPNPRTKLTINTAYRCELQTAFAMARQAQRGFRIHTAKAIDRVVELDAKIKETEENFRPHMPLRLRIKKLTKPVNGYTHGSYFTTNEFVTKKLTTSQWCLHTGKPSDRTQKSWLAEFPIKQDNTVGEYNKKITNKYPEARGFITDHANPLVAGAFTPVEWEEIPLGNRDSVKQILHANGWLGVVYNDAEQSIIDDGDFADLKPWAGKIEEESVAAWEARGGMPDWCKGIADWYILSSRRNQILNKKDQDYYDENKAWPRQASKKNECRGILAKTYNEALCMTAMEYYERMGEWPTDMDEEWRAPAEAFACATNTFRMRHKVVVNIPSRGLYPLRDLFIAGKGMAILGCDGSGLELRMLAHFLSDAAYQDIVLNGDIHAHNQKLAGLPTRDMAKTFIYAFLYGSGVRNLAAVCGMSEAEMTLRIAKFKEQLPALPDLIERIGRQGEQFGYLLSVDGRFGRIRARDGKLLVHTMLNVLLQMTGSIAMKYSLCFAERQMTKEDVGLDTNGFVTWVVNSHDEYQMEVPEAEVEVVTYSIKGTDWKVEEKAVYNVDGKMFSAPTVLSKENDDWTVQRKYHRAGQICCETMTKAGKFLKLRCPLAGEYKIGSSWAETH